MKDKKYQITTIILSVVTILLSGYIVTDKLIAKEPSEANSTSNVDNPESMEDKISSDEICSFTKTHHIIDLLEDYQGEVPEMTFILVDHFQNHYPIVLGMPNTLKKELKENKYYEFTYTVPKNNN